MSFLEGRREELCLENGEATSNLVPLSLGRTWNLKSSSVTAVVQFYPCSLNLDIKRVEIVIESGCFYSFDRMGVQMGFMRIQTHIHLSFRVFFSIPEIAPIEWPTPNMRQLAARGLSRSPVGRLPPGADVMHLHHLRVRLLLMTFHGCFCSCYQHFKFVLQFYRR